MDKKEQNICDICCLLFLLGLTIGFVKVALSLFPI